MNPFEFVLAIIIITFTFTLIKHKMGITGGSPRQTDVATENRDNDRLRQQVQQLQERIRVLERIVTDSGVQTAAQIEALRDQDRIPEEDRISEKDRA